MFLNSLKVLEKYWIPLSGLEKSSKFNTLSTPHCFLWKRGYYMAACRYQIPQRLLKNISRVSAANEWNIFSTREAIIGSNHQATARKMVTIRDNEKLKTIHTGCGTWCCDRCYLKKIGFHNCNRLRNRYTCQKIQTSETKLQFSQRCTVIKNLFSIEKYSAQNDTWSHALNVITYM